MISETERAKILEMIEDGSISAEEGLTLLNALDGTSSLGSDPAQDHGEVSEVSDASADQADPERAEVQTVIPQDPEIASGDEEPVPESASLTEETWGQPVPEASGFEPVGEPVRFDREVEIIPPKPVPPDTDDMEKWKRWWVIPFWIGAGITVIGGLLMYWAFNASGFGFWFACAWFPFLLGVAVLVLGWSSRTTPWLHVRINQAPGESPRRIAISFPIPIRLTAWVLRTFGHFIPHMEGANLDEVILALKDVARDGTPLSVDVNEGEDGEHVQVFIG
jgi:hypothetical protein